ncbi:hypothetical protein [uncultured Litoreibacter sp.]|uniref:hypothetical protein n=1 Tax=uncultured Litoreibacter sp. TaxID=1392394 RepID=UPI0026104054|nr:hypothetical protein [uncultured Litoreibacter sp.]
MSNVSSGTKDILTVADIRQRLDRELCVLLTSLAFCEEYLSRPSLTDPPLPLTLQRKSLLDIFYAFEDAAYLAAARLWDEDTDAITLVSAKKLISNDIKDIWQARYEELNEDSKIVRVNLLNYRDEELGHNLMVCRRRFRAGEDSTYSKKGELHDFIVSSTKLLFDALNPTMQNAGNDEAAMAKFKLKFSQARWSHVALLNMFDNIKGSMS